MAADFASQEYSVHSEPALVSSAGARSTRSNSELWRTGRYRELSQRLAIALANAESRNDQEAWIAAANDLACAHRALAEYDTAAYFQLLTVTSEARSLPHELSSVSPTSLGNLACDALASGKLAIAENLLWKSLLVELASGNAAGAAADWANLGLVAGMSGELPEAKARLWEALKRHRRLNDAFHLGLDLWHLAQLFEIDRHWDRAAKLFEKAANQFLKVGNQIRAQEAALQCQVNLARSRVLKFDPAVN